MRISVVIATYNRAPLLQATLEQLRGQHYEPDDEVIVVDNASTDRTAEVIARAARGFPVALHQLRESTPGKSPALNAGLALARGDVLALTDDDVIVASNWIAAVRQIFRDSSIALVGGRVDPRWERPPPLWLGIEEGQKRYGPMCSPLALLHYGRAQELGARTAVGANLVIRRTVLEALGGFAPHLGRRRGTLLCGEDHDLCKRAVEAGYRCEYRPELRVRHWVPAERLRLRYHVRWFMWSGITNAVLERDDRTSDSTTRKVVPLYYLRRLLTEPFEALADAVRGRIPDAAEHVMAAAFAFGNIYERIRWWARGNPPSAERSTMPAPLEQIARLPPPAEPPVRQL